MTKNHGFQLCFLFEVSKYTMRSKSESILPLLLHHAFHHMINTLYNEEEIVRQDTSNNSVSSTRILYMVD